EKSGDENDHDTTSPEQKTARPTDKKKEEEQHSKTTTRHQESTYHELESALLADPRSNLRKKLVDLQLPNESLEKLSRILFVYTNGLHSAFNSLLEDANKSFAAPTGTGTGGPGSPRSTAAGASSTVLPAGRHNEETLGLLWRVYLAALDKTVGGLDCGPEISWFDRNFDWIVSEFHEKAMNSLKEHGARAGHESFEQHDTVLERLLDQQFLNEAKSTAPKKTTRKATVSQPDEKMVPGTAAVVGVPTSSPSAASEQVADDSQVGTKTLTSAVSEDRSTKDPGAEKQDPQQLGKQSEKETKTRSATTLDSASVGVLNANNEKEQQKKQSIILPLSAFLKQDEKKRISQYVQNATTTFRQLENKIESLEQTVFELETKDYALENDQLQTKVAELEKKLHETETELDFETKAKVKQKRQHDQLLTLFGEISKDLEKERNLNSRLVQTVDAMENTSAVLYAPSRGGIPPPNMMGG
ncbi:unnamed protein product, partial [Amoebophrya sp. A120]